MSNASIVRNIVQQYPDGTIFSYDDLKCDRSAAAIELSRLYKKGILQKLSRGRFYKPKKGMFGEIKPNEEQIIQSYQKQANGYETGLMAFNRLGLTTQIPSLIEIATDMTPRTLIIGSTTIKLVRAKRSNVNTDKRILQILDALRQIKKIPDTTPSETILALKKVIAQLPKEQIESISTICLDYTPRTIALLGAILEDIGQKKYTLNLKKRLNPTSYYKLALANETLLSAKNWKII